MNTQAPLTVPGMLAYNRRVWIQRLVRSRAFRIFDRTSAILTVVCFAIITWQSSPPLSGIFGILTAFLALAAALNWHLTKPAR